MKIQAAFATVLFVLAFPTPPYAQEAGHALGQHPAVLVKQKEKAAPAYDYQAQFYPHPAWLWLETDRHPMGDHPAVIVKRRQGSESYDYVAQFYPHPAWMYLETDHHELGDHPAVLVARRATRAAAAAAAAAAEAATAADAQPQVLAVRPATRLER